jgi:hypothetical protein
MVDHPPIGGLLVGPLRLISHRMSPVTGAFGVFLFLCFGAFGQAQTPAPVPTVSNRQIRDLNYANFKNQLAQAGDQTSPRIIWGRLAAMGPGLVQGARVRTVLGVSRMALAEYVVMKSMRVGISSSSTPF